MPDTGAEHAQVNDPQIQDAERSPMEGPRHPEPRDSALHLKFGYPGLSLFGPTLG
jgi:hypothetical protein